MSNDLKAATEEKMSLHRSKFLYLSLCALTVFGCSVSGQIGLSHPRVWRQETLGQDATSRLHELKSTRKQLGEGLRALAGERIRREIIATQVKASAVSVNDPTKQAGVVKAEEAKPGAAGDIPELGNKNLAALGEEMGEEALDILRRQEDFGDIFTGTLLKYIRDDLSLRPDRELFLLAFDISVTSGGLTSSSGWISNGYSAHVRAEIVEPKDSARVYAVSPQQYAERFREALGRRNDVSLALDVEKQGPGQGARFALDRARKSQEELALIQRYPLISGFADGPLRFGWQINPRFRVIDQPWYLSWLSGRYGIESNMEDGLRSGLAAIDVRANREQDQLLKLRVTSFWESTSLHHRVGEKTTEMNVVLPKNPVKKFSPTAIHPASGPGNQENVVTIKGDEFGSRAEVYIGARKACSVRVLSRSFLEATLPKCYKGEGCDSPHDIKVISHGDSYLDAGKVLFTYTEPFAEPKDGNKVCASRPDTE